MSALNPTTWTVMQCVMAGVIAVGFTAIFIQDRVYWKRQLVLWNSVEALQDEVEYLRASIGNAREEIAAVTDEIPAVVVDQPGPAPTIEGLSVARPPVPVPDDSDEFELKEIGGRLFRIKRQAG